MKNTFLAALFATLLVPGMAQAQQTTTVPGLVSFIKLAASNRAIIGHFGTISCSLPSGCTCGWFVVDPGSVYGGLIFNTARGALENGLKVNIVSEAGCDPTTTGSWVKTLQVTP